MKRLFSVILLAILCLNLVGGYVYFFFRSLQIKQAMREHIQTLPNDQLSQFSFSVEVFNRARVDDHELKIDGKMYDIVRVKTEGNQVHVFAMHDASEDSLLGFLDATLKRLEADATQPPGSIMYFTLLAYTPVQIDFQFSSPLISKIIFSEFTLDTPGITLPIDSPPPKI